MVALGYALLGEEHEARSLVRNALRAEEAVLAGCKHAEFGLRTVEPLDNNLPGGIDAVFHHFAALP